MAKIETRAIDETKMAFRAEAKRRGVTESALLSQLIATAIDPSAKDVQTANSEPIEPVAGKIEPARINLRLPEFLLDGARVRAKAKGMSTNRWLIALVQTHLTCKPVMTDYEIAVLNSSARELSAIGRNLNQIAKALNESFHETDRVNLKMLNELVADIKTNRLAIRNLVRSSLHAWGVSP